MNLDAFKKFSTYKKPEIKKEEVWSYTRVSSKEQYNSNGSLDNQKNKAKEYANENGYLIAYEFGGTYESAKADFTRKEFSNMINEIRKAKKKPLAILIYKMSRFSRSGSGGIAVVHELVDKLGVHLIETSTGLSTLNIRDKNTLLGKLVDAEKENIERLEITVPGMKSFLRKGKWLGKAPLGYDHYGPRVKDVSKYAPEQKLKINDQGRLLQKAWQWKLEGVRDFQIIQQLKVLGLTMSKQAMSDLWRKPFYCGVIANRMLEGEVTNGNWEPLVSKEDFLRVQKSLENNNVGYKVSFINENRPLTGFVVCACCGNKLTSYEVKKKGLHYYTCQNKCDGSTMNAQTTLKSKKEGLNDSFAEYLSMYELNDNIEKLFREQLSNTISVFNADSSDIKKRLEIEISKENQKKESLEQKYLFDGLQKSVYEKYLSEINTKLNDLEVELQKVSEKISNQDNVIDKCVYVAKNLSKHWCSSDVNDKLMIQNLVFPSGLLINPKNRLYLTKEVNAIFSEIPVLSRDSKGQKKDAPDKKSDASSMVAGTRLERATFGL